MMIKALLALSLLANVFLLFRSQSSETEVVKEEKLVLKKSPPKVVERKVYVEVPAKTKVEAAGASTTVEYDEKDMEDLVTKVTEDRDEFLQGELGLTQRDFEKVNKVKEIFNRRYQEVVPKNHYGELTIEQRRQLLELDQLREEELGRAVGESKWKRFQQFRDEYNRRMFSRQVHEKGMIIPMEI